MLKNEVSRDFTIELNPLAPLSWTSIVFFAPNSRGLVCLKIISRTLPSVSPRKILPHFCNSAITETRQFGSFEKVIGLTLVSWTLRLLPSLFEAITSLTLISVATSKRIESSTIKFAIWLLRFVHAISFTAVIADSKVIEPIFGASTFRARNCYA